MPDLPLLDKTWYGATVLQWLLATATLAGVYVALFLLRELLSRRLGAVALEGDGSDAVVREAAAQHVRRGGLHERQVQHVDGQVLGTDLHGRRQERHRDGRRLRRNLLDQVRGREDLRGQR